MRKKIPLPSLEHLKSVLSYNSETGVFLWLNIKHSQVKPGDIAGSIDSKGYRQISIDGVSFMAHRLAWKFVHGVDPEIDLDHKNRVRADNRISNLRLATCSQNMCNSKPKKSGSSRFKGVSKNPKSPRWRAEICLNRKRINLGYFDSEVEAHEAYKKASQEVHGEFGVF